jgi:hypothetical protein
MFHVSSIDVDCVRLENGSSKPYGMLRASASLRWRRHDGPGRFRGCDSTRSRMTGSMKG